MRLAWLLPLLAIASFAQTPTPPASTELHADAIKLVEISGGRQRLQAALPQIITDGGKKFADTCGCTAQFVAEWQKRFAEQFTVQSFLNVSIAQYEKFFTDAELRELIQLQTAQNAGTPATPSAALTTKMAAQTPALMGAIVGGCSELGARIGTEIAKQIGLEHPDWVKAGTAPKPLP